MGFLSSLVSSFFSSLFSGSGETDYYYKGEQGEYLIYRRLQKFEDVGARFLFNLYIPKPNNGTTEIDLLLICSKGLFVIESKNYSGWIFGNEANKNWTQVLPVGRGRSHKSYFYNPIKQNANHIKYLRRLVGKSMPIWSIIVFSDECELKDVTIKSRDVDVVYLSDVLYTVTEIHNEVQGTFLSQKGIDFVYEKLSKYTQADDETIEQHVSSINR